MNVTEQRLETVVADLLRQLAAANQRIGDLEHRLEISGAISADVENDLRRQLEAAERKLATCKRLVDKLHAVHADERYQAVWINYMIHGCTYTEPKYEQELKEATEALAQIEQPLGTLKQQPFDEDSDTDFEQVVADRLANGAKFQPRKRQQSTVAETKRQLPGEDPPFDACRCPACVDLRARAEAKP